VLAAPMVRVQQKARGRTTGMAEHPALPARWVDGLYVISPGTGSIAPVSRRACRARAWPQHREVRTTRFRRPHRCCSSGTRLRAATRYGHRIPASRIVTIARTPLSDEAGCM